VLERGGSSESELQPPIPRAIAANGTIREIWISDLDENM
jgi:hypothetical protein